MSIEVKKVSFIYSPNTPFEIKALDNIDLKIKNNSYVSIIGQTGSGKSTLIQLFNGLIVPNKGSVIVNGIKTDSKENRIKIRKQVGIVFQYPEHQLFEETVSADIAYGPKNMGFDEAEIDRRVKQSLEDVGLGLDLLEKSPYDLSGGQMRRVAMAGVLAMRPQILVLDEPTAGLDPISRRDILDLVKSLHEKQNITIITVTHDMEEAAKYAERIVVLNKGSIVLDGTPREVFKENNELRKIGLSAPPLTLLFTKLRAKGFNVPSVILSEKEAVFEICKELGVEIDVNKH